MVSDLRNWKTNLVLCSLIPLILTIGIVPATPFVQAQLDENSKCPTNKVLVKRYSDNTFHCLDRIVAITWDTYGTGEIIETNPTNSQKIPTKISTSHIDSKPNIIVIMPDDVGWYNIGAYHEGIMSGLTPNIDKIAEEGIRFTDYYAEPSCTLVVPV